MQRLLGCVGDRLADLLQRWPVELTQFHALRGTSLRAANAPHHWVAANRQLLVAVAGKPRFENPTAESPAQRILKEFPSAGIGVVEQMKGSFAIAIVDATAGRAVLAID